MATDPNLSDSNLPESSANLGFEDWTGSKGVLDKDIKWLRDAFIKHLGQDYWNSRNEYPHPNQAVSLLYFMDGKARLFDGGLQFAQTSIDTQPTISVVSPQFQDNPSAYYPRFEIAPYLNDNTFPQSFFIGIKTSGVSSDWYGLFVERNTDLTLRLQVAGNSFEMDGAGDQWRLTGPALRVPTDAGDLAAPEDGSIFYNTTTDNFRVRVAGALINLLTSSSIIVLSNLDLPYVSVSANTTTTSSQCFVDVDASGAGRTITLPSAATLTSGFTYIIRKLDSSNNTVVIDPNSTQTIDGVTTYTLTKQYETVTLVSNGTNWDIWGAYNNQLYVAQTATFTVGPRDTTISVSTAAGAVTANLPTAVGIAGREITIKKTTNDANFLTLDGSGSETIEGVSTYIITSIGEVTIYSNGANWLVKSESFGGYITRTTTYTTTITDRKVTANASGGAFTITLIAASSVAGERVMFRKIGTDTNLVTLDANSSETIDGAATLGLMTPGEWAELLSDGTNWLIVGYGS